MQPGFLNSAFHKVFGLVKKKKSAICIGKIVFIDNQEHAEIRFSLLQKKIISVYQDMCHYVVY